MLSRSEPATFRHANARVLGEGAAASSIQQRLYLHNLAQDRGNNGKVSALVRLALWWGLDLIDPVDCLVIGAGPAGLTAAIYFARFRLSLRVVDAGSSRAALIPNTRNHAGFPGGISGANLLDRMRRQATEFGVKISAGCVEALAKEGDFFAARVGAECILARSVLLTTGVVNNRPAMAPAVHDTALAQGLLRYCPICDGYEVTDRRVGIVGTAARGANEAIFLRMFTKDVTLISPEAEHRLSDEEQDQLRSLDIVIVDGPCGPLGIDGSEIVMRTSSGTLRFDTIYPALGSVIRSELAIDLGARASTEGCMVVDDHQRTSVVGLYAAGDVTKGLDQISHAMGEAGVAATTIRNDLAKLRSLAR